MGQACAEHGEGKERLCWGKKEGGNQERPNQKSSKNENEQKTCEGKRKGNGLQKFETMGGEEHSRWGSRGKKGGGVRSGSSDEKATGKIPGVLWGDNEGKLHNQLPSEFWDEEKCFLWVLEIRFMFAGGDGEHIW